MLSTLLCRNLVQTDPVVKQHVINTYRENMYVGVSVHRDYQVSR
jgi:hypothetical protein